MEENKEELKSFLIKVKEESENVGLKLNTHEIKMHLVHGKKVMTKLGSIFKTRDITLPTKVHIVKAMVLPVARYGC